VRAVCARRSELATWRRCSRAGRIYGWLFCDLRDEGTDGSSSAEHFRGCSNFCQGSDLHASSVNFNPRQLDHWSSQVFFDMLYHALRKY